MDFEDQIFIDSQKTFLEDLIRFNQPINQLLKRDKIGFLDWDSSSLAIINRSDISNVLKRFIEGDISSKCVYDWSSALADRETIQAEHGYASHIWGLIIEIESNHSGASEEFSLITKNDAKRYIKVLNSLTFDPTDD